MILEPLSHRTNHVHNQITLVRRLPRDVDVKLGDGEEPLCEVLVAAESKLWVKLFRSLDRIDDGNGQILSKSSNI